MRNHRRLLKKITAGVLAALLLVAVLPPKAVAMEGCQGWNTAKFFKSATLEQVRACLSTGRGPNEPDRKGLTALHRAARDTSDAAVIEALLEAGADPRASSRAGRLPPYYARKNKKIKGSDAYQQLRLTLAKKPDWSRVQAVPPNTKTAVRLYRDVAPPESWKIKVEDQGPLRLGHGQLHHSEAQGRADAHAPQDSRAQGTYRPPVRQTMAGLGRPGGYIFIPRSNRGP